MTSAKDVKQSTSTKLPAEILLLICQELAANQEFGTLYQMALTATVLAPIALEQLYSIYDNSNAIFGYHGKRAWMTLWRSILLSTKGQTAYPYAAYIRSLPLGKNLYEYVYDMLGDRVIREALFGPPLEGLLCLMDESTPRKKATRASRLPRVDNAITVGRCGEAIIEYVERLARESRTKVSLAHLEINSVASPFDLSDWCLRLGSGLVSLSFREGTILNANLGAILAEFCPNFTDLTLFNCITSVELVSGYDHLTAFLNELRPHSLRSFQVMSRNDIGADALKALGRQSGSLQTLKLSCLDPDALKAMVSLSDCTKLEYLAIENDDMDMTNFIPLEQDGELANKLSSWIGRCPLREFHIKNGYNALLLVRDLLCTSETAVLESLTLWKFALLPIGQNQAIFKSLTRHKNTLRELRIGGFWDGDTELIFDRVSVSFLHTDTPTILNSICELKQLRRLYLPGATIDQDDLSRILRSLPQLEELQIMTYELLGDDELVLFRALRNLKSLVISSPSDFSHDALVAFVKSLDPVRQYKVEVSIAQVRQNEAWQDMELKEHMSVLNGTLSIDTIRNFDADDAEESSDSD